MAVNGRAKGQVFERELARTISVWWTGRKELEKVRAEELPFRRTPLSGGWDRKAAASDLLVVEPGALPVPWPFALEAKNQECWNWDGLFKANDKWPVKAYWDQCCEAAEKSKLTPLVLFTRKLQPIYFAMPAHMPFRLGIAHINVSWLPFAIGRFDDLLKMTPQRIVVEVLGQIEAHRPHQVPVSSEQTADVATSVPSNAGKSKPAPKKASKCPGCRVPDGEPQRVSPRVFVREYGDLPMDRVEELERERELEVTKRRLRIVATTNRAIVLPAPESVGEPVRVIPTKRPMMLKCYHGKWKKVPVPMKDWKNMDESQVLGVTR
jgi:hypothetical protein